MGFDADCVTLNGYMGSDARKTLPGPWRKAEDKSLFVLVQAPPTPAAGELQNRGSRWTGRSTRCMGDLVEQWGEGSRSGKYGYHPGGRGHRRHLPGGSAQAARQQMPHTFFLVPGYGAQGGTAEDVASTPSTQEGKGAIVNSSRGIMCAWQKTGQRRSWTTRKPPGRRPLRLCGRTSALTPPSVIEKGE